MKPEGLIERCQSLDAADIRMRELTKLELSDENKRKLMERSESFAKWAREKWKPFIADLQPNDEVWRFSSPPETWANLCGCAGYCVVRNGAIVSEIVTARN